MNALTFRRVHRHLFKSVFIVCNINIILWDIEVSTESLLSSLVVGLSSLLIYNTCMRPDLIQADWTMLSSNLVEFNLLKICLLLVTLFLSLHHFVV